MPASADSASPIVSAPLPCLPHARASLRHPVRSPRFSVVLLSPVFRRPARSPRFSVVLLSPVFRHPARSEAKSQDLPSEAETMASGSPTIPARLISVKSGQSGRLWWTVHRDRPIFTGIGPDPGCFLANRRSAVQIRPAKGQISPSPPKRVSPSTCPRKGARCSSYAVNCPAFKELTRTPI